MEQSLGKKIFHICMIIAIIVAIFLGVGILMLRYQTKGETNLPFEISKIAIISSVDGINNPNAESPWNITVNQNNDVYLYIDKNKDYNKTEAIDTIIIDNISINKEVQKGEIHIYKPAQSDKELFQNTEENLVEQITYTGDIQSNIKELKIANQGDLLRLRFANDNLSTYTSTEGEQIDYGKLLQLTNTTIEDLKANVKFDITLNLKSGKSFKANVTLDIPVQEVIEKGTASTEITELNNIIFKRIENN
ncbi:MAG: hypothetical protein IKF83_04595 [Clostridia bacterium]|nr:hypothetical protein [Clostridia bacterium]